VDCSERFQADVSITERSRPLKILHIINDLSIGGAEMMLYRLLYHEREAQLEPSVISLMDRGPLRQRIKELGISVLSPGMSPAVPSPQSVFRLIRLVRQLKPDLIHGWLYHGSLAAQFASAFSGKHIPAIWSIHYSMYSLGFEKKLTAAAVRLSVPLSRRAAAIVFVSRTSELQHRDLGYSLKKSFVIPNGIDTDEFSPCPDSRLSLRSELGLPEDALLIGLINRYHPMKDHANFLKAASKLAAKYPQVHFLLAGRGVDHTNSKLMFLIRELALSSRTHLLGERTDIARLTAALDVLSLSSLYGESFPVIVGEAMACGVPCVVTDVGDSGWLIGETGRKVAPGNPEQLANAWEELVLIGPEGRAALGNAARQRVITHFSLPSIADQYRRLYQNTLIASGTERSAHIVPTMNSSTSTKKTQSVLDQ